MTNMVNSKLDVMHQNSATGFRRGVFVERLALLAVMSLHSKRYIKDTCKLPVFLTDEQNFLFFRIKTVDFLFARCYTLRDGYFIPQ